MKFSSRCASKQVHRKLPKSSLVSASSVSAHLGYETALHRAVQAEAGIPEPKSLKHYLIDQRLLTYIQVENIISETSEPLSAHEACNIVIDNDDDNDDG